jgi:hypothetical protein
MQAAEGDHFLTPEHPKDANDDPQLLTYESLMSGHHPPATNQHPTSEEHWDDQPDLDEESDVRLTDVADIINDIAEQRRELALHGTSDPPDIPLLAAWLLLGMRYELRSFTDPQTLDEMCRRQAEGDPDVEVFDGLWIGRDAALLRMDGNPVPIGWREAGQPHASHKIRQRRHGEYLMLSLQRPWRGSVPSSCRWGNRRQ